MKLNSKKKLLLSLFFLFILSFLLRIHRIGDYFFFGFEQGRDALVAENIIKKKDFVLVGPKTDIGGIFHGAWYYYILASFYFFSSGNPLLVNIFFIFINSFVPFFFFLLLKDILKSDNWAFLGGILCAISFELISYSRWLSNVNLAVICIVFAFWFLWKFQQNKNKEKYFIISIFCASLASQFQILLTLWFFFVYLMCFLFRFITIPSLKTLIKGFFLCFILFLPLLVFNFRNDFITLKSIYGANNKENLISLSGSFKEYFISLDRLLNNSLVGFDFLGKLFFFVICFFSFWQIIITRKQHDKSILLFFSLWFLMTLPVVFFRQGVNLIQIYIGTTLGLIGLTIFLLMVAWRKFVGKFFVVVFLFIIVSNLFKTIGYIDHNQKFFFITIQDDLNYHDQRDLINYIHQNSQNNDYQLKAFTIPYYQSEGWDYLHRYLYPLSKISDSASLIYIIIEEKVDPYWQKKWIQDIGQTKLLEEKFFGKIKLEKRQIL